MLKNFRTQIGLERKYGKADQSHDELIRERFAALGYDDYSFSDSGSGSGDALSSILQSIGSGIQAGASVYQATQYGPTQPAPSLISNNNVSAHAPSMGNNSLLWIIVLIVVGFFAYKEL